MLYWGRSRSRLTTAALPITSFLAQRWSLRNRNVIFNIDKNVAKTASTPNFITIEFVQWEIESDTRWIGFVIGSIKTKRTTNTESVGCVTWNQIIFLYQRVIITLSGLSKGSIQKEQCKTLFIVKLWFLHWNYTRKNMIR